MATVLAMRALVAARGPLEDAKETLSSWDKCMDKNYCKWPVIAAIIIGGIIVLSTVLCIARCICCGAELACCCFKCCTCCCPSGGRSKKNKAHTPPPHPYPQYPQHPPPNQNPSDYLPPAPPINHQQYRSHAAPSYSAPAPAPAPLPTFRPAPKREPDAPSYARFDAHAALQNEDALPAMPVWKDAKSVHVEEEVIPEKHDDVEMDRLDQHGSLNAMGGARMAPSPARSPVQHRIQTEDGRSYSPGYQNRAYPPPSPHNSPGGFGAPGQYGQQQDAYRSQQSLSPVHAVGAGYAQGQQYGRQSPRPAYDQNYQQSSGRGDYDQGYAGGYNQHDQYPQDNPYAQRAPAHSPPPLNTANHYGYGNAEHHQPAEYSPLSHDGGHGVYDNGYAPAPAPVPARMPSPPHALTPGISPTRLQSPGYAHAPSMSPERVASPTYSPPTGLPASLSAGHVSPAAAKMDIPSPSGTPAPAYPGQQTYGSSDASSTPAAQQPYRAFTPAQQIPSNQASQPYGDVSRKPVDNSWKEL